MHCLGMTPTVPLTARRSRVLSSTRIAFAVLIALLLVVPAMRASELLQNGGFESGDTYNATNWDPLDIPSGSWARQHGTQTPNGGDPVSAPPDGSYAMMASSFDGAAGTHYLVQDFTAPSDMNTFILSFDLYIASAAAFGLGQQASVDLLSADQWKNAANPLATILLTNPSDSLISGYTVVTKDLSQYITPGTTYRLRFTETNSLGYLRMGLDDVSLSASFVSAPPPTDPGPGDTTEAPEPASMLLMGFGLVGIGFGRKLLTRD
jgi:hypothetical protein